MKKSQQPLGVTVVGMDDRSLHTLQLFFQGACKNGCEIVESSIAEISIVDMDTVNAESLYKQQREKFPKQVFILLSLTDREEEAGAFFVKKPIELKVLTMVLERIRKGVRGAGIEKVSSSEPDMTPTEAITSELPQGSGQRSSGKINSSSSSTHRSAMSLDEKSFISFIGALKNIDLNNKDQIDKAHYDPKAYLQGYFQSACKVALNKNQVLKLDGSWKPLILFPRTHEVWLDANDKQLQAACRMPLGALADAGPTNEAKSSGMSMSLVSDVSKMDIGNKDHFQDMDSFLWKVSLWTSQGRVPLGVDLDYPVCLKHWPNMTRLMLFPHAMRIAALMISEPRSLLEIARLLNIPPQYVFAFYSAARALGLAGQVKRQADMMVAPQPIQKPKQRGLFGKILDRLKMGK